MMRFPIEFAHETAVATAFARYCYAAAKNRRRLIFALALLFMTVILLAIQHIGAVTIILGIGSIALIIRYCTALPRILRLSRQCQNLIQVMQKTQIAKD